MQKQSSGLPVFQSTSRRKARKNTKDARCEVQKQYRVLGIGLREEKDVGFKCGLAYSNSG